MEVGHSWKRSVSLIVDRSSLMYPGLQVQLSSLQVHVAKKACVLKSQYNDTPFVDQ